MSPVWPFGRNRGGRRGAPAPVPFTPRRTEWQLLPPLQRVVGDQWLVNPADSLSAHLASWRDPSFLAPLGHEVPPDGPSGAIEPAPARTEPKRIDLQRSATTATPISSATESGEAPDSALPVPTPTGLPALPNLSPPDPPRPPAAVQRTTPAEEPRPLLGEAGAMATTVDPLTEAPEPATTSGVAAPTIADVSPTVPHLPVGSTRPSAQPATIPFAVQRLAGMSTAPVDSRRLDSPVPVPVPVPVRPAALSASLLAASDAPERRSLPVVTTPTVQRAAAAAEPPAPAAPVQRRREAAAEPEIAPLIGEPGLGGPIDATVRTAPSEAVDPQVAADPPASSGPPPTVPLIAHRPTLQRVEDAARAPLGLGAPQSGPMAVPSSAPVPRGSSATPDSAPAPPTVPPMGSSPRIADPVAHQPSRPEEPAAATVVVSRTAGPSAQPMPVAARSIDSPAPAYRPPEPTPIVPLLGDRALQPLPAPPETADAPAADLRAPHPSVDDGLSVQRSTWSHMPQPAIQSAASPATILMPLSTPTAPTPAQPVVSRLAAHAAPHQPLPQAVPVQRFGNPVDRPEPTAAPVETVVQRVSVDRPEPHVVVQREEAPAAPGPAPGPAPPEAAGADPGELLAVLYEPLMRRLRADLRVDRERRGRLTDL